LICLGCFMQMMIIATYMQSGFYKYVSVGLAIEYIVQVFLTIGGAVKFIPSTGVTLPFVSYGGSSLVSSFIVFAIIQALYIIQGNEDEAETEINEMAEDEAERELYGEADEPSEEYLDENYDANAVFDDIPEEYEDPEPDQGRGFRRRRRR
jgi:hypothetical protein